MHPILPEHLAREWIATLHAEAAQVRPASQAGRPRLEAQLRTRWRNSQRTRPAARCRRQAITDQGAEPKLTSFPRNHDIRLHHKGNPTRHPLRGR